MARVLTAHLVMINTDELWVAYIHPLSNRQPKCKSMDILKKVPKSFKCRYILQSKLLIELASVTINFEYK